MKLLKRNLQTIYYKLYEGVDNVVDDEGFETGEKELTYSQIYSVKANVSEATGSVAHEQFGLLDDYDKVVLLEDVSLPITEETIFSLDFSSENSEDITFDYRVKRISKSLNVLSIALKKVC